MAGKLRLPPNILSSCGDFQNTDTHTCACCVLPVLQAIAVLPASLTEAVLHVPQTAAVLSVAQGAVVPPVLTMDQGTQTDIFGIDTVLKVRYPSSTQLAGSLSSTAAAGIGAGLAADDASDSSDTCVESPKYDWDQITRVSALSYCSTCCASRAVRCGL